VSLEAALESQLGLMMQAPREHLVDFIVIDYVEQPSES
jgi:hypothetical protein